MPKKKSILTPLIILNLNRLTYKISYSNSIRVKTDYNSVYNIQINEMCPVKNFKNDVYLLKNVKT